MYFVGCFILKMDYKQFLKSTPRQVIGLDILYSRYQEAPFLTSYIKINKPVNSSENTDNNGEKIEKRYVNSLLDL